VILRSPWFRTSGALLLLLPAAGCRSPASHREQADKAAYSIVRQTRAALGRDEAFTIEPPAESLRRRLMLEQDLPRSGPASLGAADVDRIRNWPDPAYFRAGTAGARPATATGTNDALRLSLVEALQVAARHSRDYQAAKEDLFTTALALDLERDAFRSSLAAALSGGIAGEHKDGETTRTATGKGSAGITKKVPQGVDITTQIGFDLTAMLTGEKSTSFGPYADASISIPLLRGAGRDIVREPLTQAERNMVYAVYDFERFKKGFAVTIASQYLTAVNRQEQARIQRDNYTRTQESAQRARRLADAGRIPEIQVDQASQSVLRSRDAWISAVARAESSLDDFKVSLGLPPDARVEPEPDELVRLRDQQPPPDASTNALLDARVDIAATNAQARAIDVESATRLALENRLDLRVSQGRVIDAQRAVAIAADQLRAEVTLLGKARVADTRVSGKTDPAANTTTHSGLSSALLSVDLPLERTRERNGYRASLIEFEAAVRGAQETEDRVKSEVRNDIRTLLESRERMRIQAQSVELARRREKSINLFLQAGRAEIRDLLEAQDALVSAEDALTSATISQRIAELTLQRDLDLLQVNDQGIWTESIAGASSAPAPEGGAAREQEP
jgi:outer membrane protein TolC